MYIKLQDIFNELHNNNTLQHTAMLSQLDYTCSANLLEILAEVSLHPETPFQISPDPLLHTVNIVLNIGVSLRSVRTDLMSVSVHSISELFI